MGKCRAVFLITFLLATAVAGAQTPTRYVIKFKNKGNNPFSLSAPQNFLSAKSIARRARYSIPFDSTDLPVTPAYIDSLRAVPGVTVLNASKWLNQVSIQTLDSAGSLSRINAFPFVLSSVSLAARITAIDALPSADKFGLQTQAIASFQNKLLADVFNYGASYNQIHLHNGEFLHNIGLQGQNMVIGMLDAGYRNFLTLKGLDSARLNNQILGTYDFVENTASVAEDDTHGMYCFSTMAANIPGQFVGTAPKAFFYLFRTEAAATEYPIEEHNWVCGAEKLDSAGADLISSSLGYNNFEAPLQRFSHIYADMNGNKTTAAIGADLAARKGLLVINAAGNEGANGWKYIVTPADGDSVLAVGAVTSTGVVGAFSSYGPSSDGQVKPDLASVGVSTVILSTNNAVAKGNGTSFATPNLAGLVACLWQGFPEASNMEIINALRQSGSIANAPDDRIGYGIPDVKKALITLLKKHSKSAVSNVDCNAQLSWTSKDVDFMSYEIERKGAGESEFQKIATMPGTGNVFEDHTYSFTDNLSGSNAGVFVYRVKQIIDTSAGAFFYFDEVKTEQPTSCKKEGLSLLPNPVKEVTHLKIAFAERIENLRVLITDMAGRPVYNRAANKPAGTFQLPLSLHHLAKGKYVVAVYNKDQKIATTSLVKL